MSRDSDKAPAEKKLPDRPSLPPVPASTFSANDPLKAFLNEISRYPLLTPEQEKDLTSHFAETGDIQAAAKLVTSNLRLVVKVAFQYRRAYRNMMDLIQEGNIGLMQAIKKFDPSRGVRLSTYAAWWIRAYILRFILDNWRIVKLGTTQNQRKLFFNLPKEKAKMSAMGEDITTEQLAERLGVSEKEVIEMEGRMHSMELSLNAEVDSGEGRPSMRMETIADDRDTQEVQVENAELDNTVQDHLEKFAAPLTEKEDFIFRRRLLSEDPMTLNDIGNHFGVSRERVRQIEKRLIEKLRRHIETEMPDYFE